MCRSPIRSQNRELPSSTIAIPTALSHTLADNRRILALQLFHQPHHLISVQMRDLPDLCVRQTGFAVLGPLPEHAQHPRLRRHHPAGPRALTIEKPPLSHLTVLELQPIVPRLPTLPPD